MRCGNCGSAVADDAVFCPECGADVEAGSDPTDAGGAARNEPADAGGDVAAGGDVVDAADADTDAGATDATEAADDDWSTGEFDWGVKDAEGAGASADERPGTASNTSTGNRTGTAAGGTTDGRSAPERSGGTAGTVTAAGAGETAGTGETDEDWADDDVDADDDDEPAFPEPTRLSRPAGSSHPEPLMGTSDEVVAHRVGAFFVDRFVLTVAVVAPFAAAVAFEPVLGPDVASLVLLGGLLVAFVFGLVYTLVLEGVYGQTLGKRLFGIVVVMEDGEPCTMGASVLRSILWVVDRFYLGLVGFGLVLTTDRNQRFGDMVADTVVVRTA